MKPEAAMNSLIDGTAAGQRVAETREPAEVRKNRLAVGKEVNSADRDNLTSGVCVSPAKSNRGRPIVHTEPWAKITVVLLDRHVAYLDRLAIDIRLKHGKAISRAELIRGLIEAAFQSGVDLSQADSIDTLVDLLVPQPKQQRKALR
jgi:hypothetical protein